MSATARRPLGPRPPAGSKARALCGSGGGAERLDRQPLAAWRARTAPAVFAPSLPSSLNVMGRMKPVGAANGAVRLTKPRVAAPRTLNVWWFSVGVDDFRFPNIMGARIHCSPTGDRGGRDPAKGLEASTRRRRSSGSCRSARLQRCSAARKGICRGYGRGYGRLSVACLFQSSGALYGSPADILDPRMGLET